MIRQVIWRKLICGKVDKQKLVIVYFNQPHFPCLMCGYLPKNLVNSLVTSDVMEPKLRLSIFIQDKIINCDIVFAI